MTDPSPEYTRRNLDDAERAARTTLAQHATTEPGAMRDIIGLVGLVRHQQAQLATLRAALGEACDLFFTTPEQRAAGFDPVGRIHALRSLASPGPGSKGEG